ncbi:hypothetical protein EDD17DRAFT_1514507 [Pisolithus thermaeus]|nr:hypothetical protein EDD17DRAFT_1515930 [Pisolithus thermaeus]KAI6147641.1 hypothetical protein EDD17DRAFT_1514507 [Pisolithus thermaeus]
MNIIFGVIDRGRWYYFLRFRCNPSLCATSIHKGMSKQVLKARPSDRTLFPKIFKSKAQASCKVNHEPIGDPTFEMRSKRWRVSPEGPRVNETEDRASQKMAYQHEEQLDEHGTNLVAGHEGCVERHENQNTVPTQQVIPAIQSNTGKRC